jgi:Ubiquitin-binding domain
VIWDALKAASKSGAETAKLITESAGIIVGPPNLTVCYDERGKPRNHLDPYTCIQSMVLSCARSALDCKHLLSAIYM